MDSSKIGNRVLDPGTEMEDRIISIKHQPVSPIAKSFKGSGRFPWEDAADFKLPESASKALEICDKLIQESKGGGASDHTSDVDEILEVKPELEELQYASTTKRRKSKPKKWGLRSLPHVNVCAPSELKCVRGADLADDVVSGHTAFRICGCKCGNPLGTGRALQCGVCGLWYHANCVQIYNATQAERETTEASKLFMCEKCTEKVITEESILAGLQGNGVSAETSKEPESFIFAQTSITPGGRVETVGMHDAWGWKEPPKNRDWVGGVAQKPRMPLTESAIQSRAENVELLRSGVRPPSIGYEERETIDSQFNKMIL